MLQPKKSTDVVLLQMRFTRAQRKRLAVYCAKKQITVKQFIFDCITKVDPTILK